METQQRSLIVTAFVGLIILAIIIGSIYYLFRFIQGRTASNKIQNTVSSSASPAANASLNGQALPRGSANVNTPGGSPGAANTNIKSYDAGDFQIIVPKNWGILTCNNAVNLEVDPTNAQDQTIACGIAQKPVTILVNETSGCSGETATLGNVKVLRSKNSDGDYIKYQWCTQTQPFLNITHRVSTQGDPATSNIDYSKQVEEMISKISFVRGS